MPTIYDLCEPRRDVLEGRARDEDFAADLAKVVRGEAPPEYQDPAVFFRHTHPTKGLKVLLETVCRRLGGAGGELNSVLRLDTQFGGGKTHALIALVHAVRGLQGVESVGEFVDPALVPTGTVRVAALDGENADPANGVRLEEGLRAHTLWGELAYRLAGREGFDRVQASDAQHVAPGTDTLVELFGGKPALILMDEVGVYLRKVGLAHPDRAGQFSAFLQSLLKAVASTPNVCLVFTLAVRSEDKEAKDAYRVENEAAAAAFEEAERVAARQATQLNPTEEDETVDVLRRRLFLSVDREAGEAVVADYVDAWQRNREHVPAEALAPEVREQFRRGYPFHPETLGVLVEKTSSLSTFQRTRGMLRLLSRTVHQLWKHRVDDATAIHAHHIDPGVEAIRGELTTRLGQGAYSAPLAADVAAVPGKPPATAQIIDLEEFAGQPPVASYVARTIFLHTLAYGEGAQGIRTEQLRWSVCSPMIEPSTVEAAIRQFKADSLFLDDRPGAPLRFLTEPNLNQMVRRAMAEIDAGEVASHLDEETVRLFEESGMGGFAVVAWPGGPYDIPDDVGDGRPYLALLHHEAFHVGEEPTSLPADIVRMATRKGGQDEFRALINNVVFVVADLGQTEKMRLAARRRLALLDLVRADRLQMLDEHRQREVKGWEAGSRSKLAIAILNCYSHLYYPSPRGGSNDGHLAHTAVDLPTTSESVGRAQTYIKRTLRDQKKLLESGDEPDAPAFVRDQTPLKTLGSITTRQLREEFRRSPRLSILLSDDPLVRCVQKGVASRTFIYRKGEQVWGGDDGTPSIEITENAFVHTMADAEAKGIWPRKPTPATTLPLAGGVAPAPGTQVADPSVPGPANGSAVPISGTAQPGTQAQPGPVEAAGSVQAEGPLRQALVEVARNAQAAGFTAIGRLTIHVYEVRGAWAIHASLATYREADVRVRFQLSSLEAEGVDALTLGFEGSHSRANAVKGFLEAQMGFATDHEFQALYALTFPTGLAPTREAAEALGKALTKVGGSEAQVTAEAQRNTGGLA